MATRSEASRRAVAAAGAGLGAFALLLQWWLLLRVTRAGGGDAVVATWRFFSYFTVLTNVLVALDLAGWAALPGRAWQRFAARAGMHTALAVAICVVAIVYHALLARLWQPQSWPWVADQLLHTVMPAVFIVYWWFAIPKAALRWVHTAACVAYPAAYVVYALARGAADGWYPYPFIDVGALGWPRTLVNVAALAVAFLVLGAVAVAVGRRQAARTMRAHTAGH